MIDDARRGLLKSACLAVVCGVAGCNGDGGDSRPTETTSTRRITGSQTATETAVSTRTSTRTRTSTTEQPEDGVRGVPPTDSIVPARGVGPEFGRSIRYADGTMLIGAPSDDTENGQSAGSVYVFDDVETG